jgi:hypothetical protein
MPHVIVKLWPGKSEQQKKTLANASRRMSWALFITGPNQYRLQWRRSAHAIGQKWCSSLTFRTSPINLLGVDERIALKSPVDSTRARCSYSELTMHSGSQLTCSELCSQNKSSQWPLGGPFIESAHDLHEPTSQQDDRAPQYEGNAVQYEMLARTGQLKHSYLHNRVHVRCKISSHQTAHDQVVRIHTPPFTGLNLHADTHRSAHQWGSTP